MLTILPQFTACATWVMAISLLLSGMAMLIVMLIAWHYVFNFNVAGESWSIDAGLAVLSFILSKVWMASVLQMVTLYNGVGGGAVSALAAMRMFGNQAVGTTGLVLMLTGALVGSVSLSGSLIAWTRLNGMIKNPLRIRGQQSFGLAVLIVGLALGATIVLTAGGDAGQLIATPGLIYGLLGCALLFGALITLPIHQAQIPLAIYSFNAITGLAIGLEGFVMRSPTLMIAGAFIGTTRVLLTLPMTRWARLEASGRG